MSGYTFGLDIGSNSIGWAVLDTEGCEVVDAGVRIFQEGVGRDTKGSEVSKNETRRLARGARRSRQRRNYRKDKLLRMLVRRGMLPGDEIELQKVFDIDPYVLRSKGLTEKLTAHEFGRVLYHINQRRGFWSNRKSGTSKEDGVVIKNANAINEAMENAGCETIGQYFASVDTHETRIRGNYTFRSMYEHEFEKLWEKQSSFDGQLLSDELKRAIKDETIFFQRPLKWDKDTVRDCELEEGHKCCPRASYFARKLRILQTVNNLKIRNPEGSESILDEGQRQVILDELRIKKEVAFNAIRKKLNLMDTQTFNLEEGSADKKNPKLKGDEFNSHLRGNKVLGAKAFDLLEESDLVEINELVINDDLTDEEVIESLMEDHGFSEEDAIAAANVSLPQKYSHFSELAIQKLLPYLEKGFLTDKAIKEVYGKSQASKKIEKFDRLPLPDDLRNPIVNKALVQVRRVVNLLINEYGKPKDIFVEMARDVKGSKNERDEIRLKQWKLEQENEAARQELIKMNIVRPSRNDIIKYKLWQECGMVCPYTGKAISQNDLFGENPVFQIEHILPYSRTLDDGYMNKTLCCVHENIDKGNLTPYEYYAESKPKQYEEVLQRIAKLPYPKRRRFLQKEVELDNFIQRQLNDTRYITKELVRYLKMLGVTVFGTKGQVTSELRHQWGLNDILDYTGAGLKNRDDHRHHAVDAAVTALTRNKHLKALAKSKYSNSNDSQFGPPWPEFRGQLEDKVNKINVSHRVTRKVSGQLHEETAYGPTGLEDEKGQDIFVYRKGLEALTPKMVDKIVDPVVKEIIKDRLNEHGIDVDKKPGSIHKSVWEKPLYMKSINGKGPLIKKVRIRDVFNNMIPIKDKSGKPYRYVASGNNHHIEIFEYTDKKGNLKREGKVVSMFEAVNRKRDNKPVICRDCGDGKTFVCSLGKNELFMLEVEEGVFVLHRIQKFDQKGSIILRPHTYAGQVSDTDKPPLIQRKSANTLNGYKVTVDPIGRIFRAND
ncbi:MAG: type II CRISPR RNA-guided endonuclease Cas9 [Phycisphaerae bacterium]|nr:type II CRISPR RNA-guided endonuclease Cas9 [Phycisphaerae bacterium]